MFFMKSLNLKKMYDIILKIAVVNENQIKESDIAMRIKE